MASNGVNKVIILGNLGQDPEVRFMPNGNAVANITVATSESWKDKQTGQQKEKTEWHRIVLYGRLAEVAGEYLRKGSKVYIEGQLQTRKWQNQQGQDQYTTEVVVQGYSGVMQMVGSRQGGQGNQGGFQQQTSAQHQGGFHQSAPQQSQGGFQQQAPAQQGGFQQQQQQQATAFNPRVNPQEPTIDFDDDIPF